MTFVDQTVQPDEVTIRCAATLVAAKDPPILAGALTASTLYLATFDQQHLLSAAGLIRDIIGIMVVPPSEILRVIERTQGRREVRQ